MKRRVINALIVPLAAAVCAVVVLLTPKGSPERVLATAVLVVVLPGAGLTSLLRISRTGGRWLLVPALSITAVILDSAALYVAGVGLGTASWGISLAAIAIVSSAIGASRDRAKLVPTWPAKPRLSRVLVSATVCTAALVTGSALLTASSVARRQRADRFTQLWALPVAGSPRVVRIGIYNHEGVALRYTLQITNRGRIIATDSLAVAPGATATNNQTLPSMHYRLTASASANRGAINVYRWVSLASGA